MLLGELVELCVLESGPGAEGCGDDGCGCVSGVAELFGLFGVVGEAVLDVGQVVLFEEPLC